MAYHQLDRFEEDREPMLPDELGHRVNELALTLEDKQAAFESDKKRVFKQHDRPGTRKLLSAPQPLVALCFLLTLGWLGVAAWEYVLSVPIYEVVVSSDFPWIPFAACMLVAVYCSACLAESSEHFAVLDEPKLGTTAAADQMLANKSWAKRLLGPKWYFTPQTGLLIAVIFLAGIYYMSAMRLELMQAANEASDDGSMMVWLPVVLYGVELLLGIPAWFATLWSITKLSAARRDKDLAKRQREIWQLQIAVQQSYTNYKHAHDRYHDWA